MTDARIADGDLELLRAIVARRNPSLVSVVDRINSGEITEQQQTQFVDALGDEIWEGGMMDAEGLSAEGDRLRTLIESIWVVPYFAQRRLMTGVVPGTDD